MASNTVKRLAGPLALTATLTTNILNPPANTYVIVRHIHVVNKTGAVATFSLWLGATGANAAGSELFSGKSVAANDVYDWYGAMRMDVADFLVGGASALTTLSIEIEGEAGAL